MKKGKEEGSMVSKRSLLVSCFLFVCSTGNAVEEIFRITVGCVDCMRFEERD